MNSQFTRLKNPRTETYLQFKQFVLGSDFPWYWNPKATPDDVDTQGYQDVPFYSHVFLARPRWKSMSDMLYPQQQSALLDNLYPVLDEIVAYNNLPVQSFMRINANCVHPQTDTRDTIPHTDHQFEHQNLIIYFSDSGGPTIAFNNEWKEYHHPQEDDIVTFTGTHFMNPPKIHRRVIVVATYI